MRWLTTNHSQPNPQSPVREIIVYCLERWIVRVRPTPVFHLFGFPVEESDGALSMVNGATCDVVGPFFPRAALQAPLPERRFVYSSLSAPQFFVQL